MRSFNFLFAKCQRSQVYQDVVKSCSKIHASIGQLVISVGELLFVSISAQICATRATSPVSVSRRNTCIGASCLANVAKVHSRLCERLETGVGDAGRLNLLQTSEISSRFECTVQFRSSASMRKRFETAKKLTHLLCSPRSKYQ